MACLQGHSWPGNIRELENVIRKMVALKSSPVLGTSDLPRSVRHAGGSRASQADPASPVDSLAEVERRHILRAMEYTRGDIHTAALLLGIGKTTLYRKLKRYGYGREDKAAAPHAMSARAG
jgi:two-component system response regulator HydG